MGLICLNVKHIASNMLYLFSKRNCQPGSYPLQQAVDVFKLFVHFKLLVH